MLQIARGRSGCGGVHVDRRRGAAGAHARAGRAGHRAEDRHAVQAEVLQRARVGDDCHARRYGDSQRRAIRQRDGRGSAGIHGLHDGRSAEAADGDARRTCVARSRMQQPLRQDVRRVHGTRAHQDPRRHLVANGGPEGLSHGVAFFNMFRDLTASGFWTSRMGIKDLQYTATSSCRSGKGARTRC